MGDLEDRLARIVVDASSPDGMISARASGQDVAVRFQAGAYRRYTESGLAHQLGQLATLTWTRYRREYLETVDAYFEDPVDDDTPEGQEFQQRLEQLVVTGGSSDRSVSVRSRGLVHWDFMIAAGTVARLPEDEFVTQLTVAVTSLLADHRARVFALRDELFDLGLPPWARQAVGLEHRGRT
jgi:hypothetical protein